ncbi:MAG: MOP flippase family protein [Polaribacter sp.]|jgi:O-antigen/teichoic acid export membrane protein|nr:MOP flippase family protein [Polaribacter sp.]
MSIKKEALSGVKWTTISAIANGVCSIIRISILTRFLDISDFGLMAIVLFILSFTSLFIDLGMTAAILHKKDISIHERSSLYWLSILFSFILFALVIFITPLLSRWYSELELLNILPIMGINLIISSVGRQFRTLEQKELNFSFISKVDVFTALIILTTSYFFAVHDFGVYSLVYSTLLGSAFRSILFLYVGLKKYSLKLHFSFFDVRSFFKIGMFNTGGQVINYFNKEIDILIVGKVFGIETLGIYSLAKQLVFRPTGVINPIITTVAIPIFSKIQNDVSLLKESYLKLLNIISSINIPVYLLVIIFANPLIEILYGSDYLVMEQLVRILCFYMIFIMLRNPMGTLTIATGRTDLEFYWTSFTFLLMPIAMLFGSFYSIEMIAIFMTITMMLLFVPLWFFVIRKMIPVDLKSYLKAYIPNYNWVKEFILNRNKS